MSGTSDMVKFLMPDGTEVSNDPRFDLEETLTEALASREYTGDAGITHDEQQAQTQVEHEDPLQGNKVDDPHSLIPNTGTPAMQIQKDDLQQAKDAGADLTSTSVEDAEPVDSNAEVEKVRKAQAEAAEAYREAMEKLGEDGEGDPDVDKGKWTVTQLRVEIAKRNVDRDEGEQIDVSGAKKKSDLVKALVSDDEANAGSAPA